MEFHVIKENDLFYLSDVDGQLPEADKNSDGYGLFLHDTRVLSEWRWQVLPGYLRRIGSDSAQNFEAAFWYSNTAMTGDGGGLVQDQSVLVKRQQFVSGEHFYEECSFENFSDESLIFHFKYTAAADYADMFDVRGYAEQTIARQIDASAEKKGLVFSYRAVDGLLCRTLVTLDADEEVHVQSAVEDGRGELTFTLQIPAQSVRRWVVTVTPTIALETDGQELKADMAVLDAPITKTSLDGKNQNVLGGVHLQKKRIEASYQEWFNRAPRVTGEEVFERWYQRGLRDLRMLATDIGHGTFPVAGVPWYSVPFGRDSLITALQSLSVNQEMARGTLATMAAFQGTEVNPSRDEQPGKIMHELRPGELTRIGLKPFGPYYGTIDATPLFLNLAADYLAWTGDLEFIRSLEGHVERAFHWLENYGDRDGDGFVEYRREAEGGISNQGWKDSGDSVMHKDGRFAEGSIALCEVQGYVYRAYAKWAEVYRVLGHDDLANAVKQKAEKLQQLFIDKFWIDAENTLALALDGNKERVTPASSNMGQVLWSQILPHDLANRLIDRLLEDDMDSGFGIRTLSTKEVRYNPISYHNGSIWPHDNSIIIAGMALYGRHDAVGRVTEGLLRASEGFALWRLPELYGGLSADAVPAPVPYPVSCSPQAWAAATPMLVLQAILNLQPDVPNEQVYIGPELPSHLTRLSVVGIPIGKGILSLELSRGAKGQTDVIITENTTGLQLRETFKEVDRVSL
ncbi:amylo-alpha-1,6-glucosidase [Alicyclobacillus curvatus]|nr:amylo-alpha-1,6-glucosidase [Alicyclobacillus curvatus]